MAIVGAVPAVGENLDLGDLLDIPADEVAVLCDHMESRNSGSSVVGWKAPSDPWETGKEAGYMTVGAAVLSELESGLLLFEVVLSALDEESLRVGQRCSEGARSWM
jgi:hypothetical protein